MLRLADRIRDFLLAGCIAGLALAAPATATASAADGQLLGAQSHSLWASSSMDAMNRELNLLDDANASAVRVDLAWSSLETDGKGQISDWYVQKIDAFLDRAQARNIKVIATLWSTPCWASTAPAERQQGCAGAWWDRDVDRYAPSDPADYADISAFVARRWGSRLAALEVWNEPNLPDSYFLKAPDPGRTYATLLKTAYPRIKRESPDLTVLGGALAFSDEQFLERLYALGIKGSFDGLSLHPYNEWRDPDNTWKREWRKYTFRTGVPAMHEVLRAHGDGGKKLWLTEFGFSTCGKGDRWCVSAQRQAKYTKDSFRIVRGWSFVKAAIAYNLRNKGSDPTDREDQFGLVRRDFTPKPAFAAFKQALRGSATGPRKRHGRVRIISRRKVALGRGGVVRVRLACSSAGPCTGRLKLLGRRPAGSAARRAGASPGRTFRIRPNSTRIVSLRLSSVHRRLIVRRGRVAVVAVATTDEAGSARRRFAVLARR